jgi:hypothetical protein
MTASTVTQYLAALSADRRAALNAVRKAINENLPTATACRVKLIRRNAEGRMERKG